LIDFKGYSIHFRHILRLYSRRLAQMLVCLLSMQAANLLPAAAAPESWEKLDKKLKPEVYELNVGIKLGCGNGNGLSDKDKRALQDIFSQ
jgi:hypothetical protein